MEVVEGEAFIKMEQSDRVVIISGYMGLNGSVSIIVFHGINNPGHAFKGMNLLY